MTQDSQEDFDCIDGVDVPIELIEGKVDNYSTEYPITYAHGQVDFQSIDKCEMVKLQDVPIEVANEQEIEACIQEEVVSDMTIPDVYRVDTEIHTDVQLETPMIKLQEKCVMQREPELVQDMALLHDTPTPAQTIAQPMTEQKVLLPDRALQGKLIPITRASWRETLRSESVRKEIPTYTDAICRSPSKPPDKQNNLEGAISKKISPYINPIYRPLPSLLTYKIPKERGYGSLKKKVYAMQNQITDPLQNPLTYLNCQGYY